MRHFGITAIQRHPSSNEIEELVFGEVLGDNEQFHVETLHKASVSLVIELLREGDVCWVLANTAEGFVLTDQVVLQVNAQGVTQLRSVGLDGEPTDALSGLPMV
ncbi:hypothetical protein [Chitinivorax sp. B]|uniref:hypothetical protein n=1 Tax=Chitinivorax sp. B TaxID=2502235 RepID=UPI0010F92009|nr:hypothetical protein [Chitinivorax sp. B]